MATADRPGWLLPDLFPFQSRYLQVAGARLHYVDEGQGPVLLLLHGNPTWSFLYRELIRHLRDRFRCLAVDFPGFGLSEAPIGYDFTPGAHARVLEGFVRALDLEDLTMMVQDWGGPIGFWVATHHPERFAGFVIANTWAWPRSDLATQVFSRLLGSRLGRQLILHRNLFVERILPLGVRRQRLADGVMAAYRGPFPDAGARLPTAVFPREILASRPFLAQVEHGLAALRDRPALIVWPTRDFAFGERERRRWEELFPAHQTVLIDGAGHYVQEDAPDELVAAIRDWHRAEAGRRETE